MLREFFKKRAERKTAELLEEKRNPLIATGKMRLNYSNIFDKEGANYDLYVFFYEKNGKRWETHEFGISSMKDRAFDVVRGEVRLWQETGELPSWAKKVSA